MTRLISDAKRREQNWIAIAQEANKANQAKTDFLRHTSHDIRTPLNGIFGMIEIADRHKDDKEKLYECRHKVLSSMEYLLSIVNNVLDIGKLESGEIILEHKPFDLVTLLVKMLTVVGMQANENGIHFSGGKEAVDKFASMPSGYYDFIFMDIMMPVMDGLEATRQIRALERSDAKTIPILAMTANAFQDDIRQSIEAGMNDHLMKPLDAQKIKQAIQEAVR